MNVMDDFEKFTFMLCLCVFLLLTLFVGSVLIYIYVLSAKGIEHGTEDDKIIEESRKSSLAEDEGKILWHYIGLLFSGTLLTCLTCFLAFSLLVKYCPDQVSINSYQVHVVESNSMSKKGENNKYLFEENLDDQFQMFDLILTKPLPKEEELELYDIVVYEVEGLLVVHRIINIEEPNEAHPDCRYFTLKGDANENVDRYPVLYSQMRSIYTGERARFIGSFILFLQSPAGYLCVLMIAVTSIAVPIMERSLDDKRRLRLRQLYYKKN